MLNGEIIASRKPRWAILFPLAFLSVFSLPLIANAQLINGPKLYVGCFGNELLRLSARNLNNNDVWDVMGDYNWGSIARGERKTAPTMDVLDIDSLIITKNFHSDNGDSLEGIFRTGSKTLIKNCGAFQVKISGGFYNSDPRGRDGQADNFAIVSVTSGKNIIIENYNIGYCTVPECHGEWAESITISPNGETTSIELTRHFIETKTVSFSSSPVVK